MRTSRHKAFVVRQRTGAVTVEMAVTTPLLFLLLFGALEIGHANMLVNSSEAAAYEGARVGIVPGATADQCRRATQRILRIAGIREAEITIEPETISSSTPEIEVHVEVPYARNSLFPPWFSESLIIDRYCRLSRENM